MLNCGSRSYVQTEVENSVGKGKVCELGNVLLYVMLQQVLPFGSNAQDLCFLWMHVQVASLLDNEEYCVAVSQCENKVSSGNANVVTICTYYAVVWRDGVCHVSYDGVECKCKECHGKGATLLYTQEEVCTLRLGCIAR